MRACWNKKQIDFEEKRFLRKLFFQKIEIKKISLKTGLTPRIIYRFVEENRWAEKRERYWLFLIRYAYRNNMSIEEICKRCEISSINILRRMKQKYKIKTKRFNIVNKRIDEDIEKKMIYDYKRMISAKKIAERYGFRSHKTVLDVLRRYGVVIREPKIITYYNTEYFEKIDSYDKAYIIGLLITDGYIIKDYNGVGIQLTISDKYLLERIAKRMGESTTVINIDYSNRREKYKKDKCLKNSKDMARLGCFSPKIANDLKKFGIIKNKTYELKNSPLIPKKYLSSFFRGLWDGDGTIGIAKNGNIWCKLICCSKDFLSSLNKLEVPVSFKIGKKTKGASTYPMRVIGGNRETIKFLKWIYKYKNDLYLVRKYEKVQNKIS